MAVQKLANGWRARRKKDGKTFDGPLRATEVAANEDARQMEEAAAVSSERLQEVFDRLLGSLSAPAVTSGPAVTQHGSNWRARVKVGRATVNVDLMWEDWGRDGQIKTVRDTFRVGPTAGRSATGLVRILITQKGDNSCKRLNCIVSAHVALIASSIYASCPFAARYFCALLLSMPTTAGCAVDLYQRTILFCAFVILILCTLCCQVLLVDGEVMRRPGAALAA